MTKGSLVNYIFEIKKKSFRWLENNRGFIVVLIVLPLSFFFGLFFRLQKWFLRLLYSAPKKHDERVSHIQTKVILWGKQPRNERKLMCTSRPNWQSLSTTFFRKDLCHKISIPLYDILELNEKAMSVKVEPFVTVGQITDYLVKRGYTLAVCLEVAEATLGGLAMGVGMTTYSHNVGLYQETVISYDVILGDGSLVTATRSNEYSDLYYTLPWSHGTLGFLVCLELQIIKIKPHIKLEYIPIEGKSKYCELIRHISGANDKTFKTPDYLEATVFSKEKAVIMVGNFADVPEGEKHKINRVSAFYKPWYFKHVETFLEKGRDYEYIPLEDYLLRHNRSIFWVVETMIPFGNNILFRWIFGWLLPPQIAFLKFTTTPGIRAMTFTKQVFQDIVLPMNKLEKQIDKAEELFNIYPILIYPCRIYDHGPHRGQLRPPRRDQMVVKSNYGMFNDIGIYGVPQKVKDKQRFDAVKAMREMEKFTRDVGGYPFLYADTFMTRKEFEEMFDLEAYEKVRAKYKANGAFPHLFDKTKPEINVFQIGEEYADPF
ncbi:UNVERIFIED_CONTAM: hypothetical protein RMT77_003642 [Armadillidium vulgare]